MTVTQEVGARPIKAWTNDIEAAAMEQLRNCARMPFILGNGIAAMPDVHMGIGATVGSVIPTERAIIPAAVGVDIGCGMNAVRTSLTASDLPDSLAELRHDIERSVPLGAGGSHREDRWGAGVDQQLFTSMTARGIDKLGRVSTKNAGRQLGSLGSGNHFIEVCLDESQSVWVMLHSGSRGIGNQIGRHFIERAKRRMEDFWITLPDADLAYLPEDTADFREYMDAVQWAQDYALENRRQMMTAVLRSLTYRVKPFDLTNTAVNCHHNYVDREQHFGRNVWVTRKGAIRARAGDMGIIPGSMGTRSYIVRGKGNVDSYNSCSHGAGRRMSRTQARKTFSVADLVKQTEGVECRKDNAVLDELPSAYKDIDQVMENQRDLVDIVHTLRAVLCVKGA